MDTNLFLQFLLALFKSNSRNLQATSAEARYNHPHLSIDRLDGTVHPV